MQGEIDYQRGQIQGSYLYALLLNFYTSPAILCSSPRGHFYSFQEHPLYSTGDRLVSGARPSASQKLLEDLQLSKADASDPRKVVDLLQLLEASETGQ